MAVSISFKRGAHPICSWMYSDWTFMAPPPDLKPLSVESVVAECLLPSLSCLPNCIQLAEDIHRILQFFPYPSRFLTYTNALRCINSDDITYAAGIMAEQAAKQIIRRVGNSEDRGNRDTVQSACQFRKLGVHAPFSVTAVLVSRAMSDDNLQEALALLMAQQMPLAFDAFGFWVTYHVINTKDSKVCAVLTTCFPVIATKGFLCDGQEAKFCTLNSES